MKGLEDEADIGTAKCRQFILAKTVIIGAGNGDLAGIDAFQPGDDHQKRSLSRSGRADKADGLAGVDGEIDVAKHVHARGA